jgi:hypothetical protein
MSYWIEGDALSVARSLVAPEPEQLSLLTSDSGGGEAADNGLRASRVLSTQSTKQKSRPAVL